MQAGSSIKNLANMLLKHLINATALKWLVFYKLHRVGKAPFAHETSSCLLTVAKWA